MKPFIHARNSANKFGGCPTDYIDIHTFIDSSKSAYAGLGHRAVLHSAFGIFLVERVFGPTILNENGKEVSVRDIAEQHVFEDLGFIPSLQDWVEDLPVKPWMHGSGAVSNMLSSTERLTARIAKISHKLGDAK